MNTTQEKMNLRRLLKILIIIFCPVLIANCTTTVEASAPLSDEDVLKRFLWMELIIKRRTDGNTIDGEDISNFSASLRESQKTPEQKPFSQQEIEFYDAFRDLGITWYKFRAVPGLMSGLKPYVKFIGLDERRKVYIVGDDILKAVETLFVKNQGKTTDVFDKNISLYNKFSEISYLMIEHFDEGVFKTENNYQRYNQLIKEKNKWVCYKIYREEFRPQPFPAQVLHEIRYTQDIETGKFEVEDKIINLK